MPRPRKWRRVCSMPKHTMFGPAKAYRDENSIIVMTVDEYETIRLIDLKGLSQAECAEIMNIGRTTAQRIYNEAKTKLAKSLVEGHYISIEGGDYELCEPNNKGCGRCKRRHNGHSGR